MNLKNHKTTYKVSLKVLFFILISAFSTVVSQNPTTSQDSTSTGYSLGTINMPNPSSISSKYIYDARTDRYIYTEEVGNFNINYPIILTPEEYQSLIIKENTKDYYKEKIKAFYGKTAGSEEAQKNLLPEFYVKSGLFETIFGGNTIEVIPQGSVEVDLGVLYSKQDNPTFSPRNRRSFSFDFDQRISLSLLGKVGTRLQVTANYDTESTFDFQNMIKLEYTPTEDDIIQKIEVGNINLPLNGSLITGAQSLFGVKTQLQFGRTTVTAVFSEQRSDSRTVIAQGGGTLEEFDFFALDYDENRHYFLAQYFRDNYDNALLNYPFINNNIQITRIEVWVTNRSNQTENVRNIVALQDLGETDKIGSSVTVFAAPGAFPDNTNNAFDPENIGGAGSQLTNAIRDIATIPNGILVPNVSEGPDYAKLENARKLQQGTEYTLQNQLGYISLNQRLNNDEVLAVAFQYTQGGKVYQVGEFANDGVDATEVNTTTNEIANNNLVVKLLKSQITITSEPIWDLMMKNVYDTGAYQLSQEDFKLNIFYNEASPLNYIAPVEGTTFPPFDNNTVTTNDDTEILDTPLIRLFHLDKLNYNNDGQAGGDGFFDYVPNITVLPQNGKIIFTKVEPFGNYLFNVLALGGEDYENQNTYNPNQEKYVYDILYKSTKTAALEATNKNKFKIKGRFKSEGGDGIPIGSFNVPRGSVVVTAGGRVLVEGVDYTVNYQLGRVQILDEALKASNIPIEVTTENNSIFGQQNKRYFGINVEHKINENFVLGATYISLRERPITQKANYSNEPINNKIFGVNGNYSTKVPFLTRLINKLPNIDTDVESNLSIRGEFAYLLPGAPNATDFNGEVTSYIDDFEGSQNGIDLKSATAWKLSSRPVNLPANILGNDQLGIQNGYGRALLNWYQLDPIFFSNQRPGSISDQDVSGVFTSRVFINELFPEQDIAQGDNTVLNTLDLVYYPQERGPYNFQDSQVDFTNNTLTQPDNSWAGITRQLTATDFEQANVEYIEFWMQNPFPDGVPSSAGKLVFNLGDISEDVLADGRKLYENGLPEDGDVTALQQNNALGWNNITVVPENQSLIYAFDTTGEERTNQDVGYDGLNDRDEKLISANYQNLEDPSNDNYTYFLNTEGDIFERYKRYNGNQGNTPDSFSDTNRGNTTEPDAEDVNRDNTMNTLNSYFEYEMHISPNTLQLGANPYIVDERQATRQLPNGQSALVTWYQFRIPIEGQLETIGNEQYANYNNIGGIADRRSIRFARMYLKEFTEKTVFRLGTLELVRSEWRRYTQTLDEDFSDPSLDDTEFSTGVVNEIENTNYASPPGVVQEELFNNNTVIRQNEQALVLNVCDLESHDARGVYKNINVDMRQYKKLRMFMHAEQGELSGLADNEFVGFIRMGNDLSQNYYQIEVPLKLSTGSSSPEAVWPVENEIDIALKFLKQIKSNAIVDGNNGLVPTFYDVNNGEITVVPSGGEYSGYDTIDQRVGILGNPNFGDIRTLMVGVKNVSSGTRCGEVWFNELRISDMENEGGWATILSMDTNLADFANLSVTGRKSTSGFGSVEQGPQERSIEDVEQFDIQTNVNVGQLFPKKWGLQIPFSYGVGEEKITPKFDEYYRDIELETQLDNTTNKDSILRVNENFTKRRSINFIGVRKNRTTDKKPRFYDIENLTFNYSHNKTYHRDFEIERSVDHQVRAGVNYAYNFEPLVYEPFKDNDSIFKNKYWKIIKDFNINFMPSSFTVTTNLNRQFNKQKFREVDLAEGNIGLEELFRRNYMFDFQFTYNHNLTKALNLNYSASNSNIIRNYFVNNQLNGMQDPSLDVWDGFFDFGDPNVQNQQLGINYQLPINKIPTFSFIDATYSYTGQFQWQKGSDLFNKIPYDGVNYNLGNAISNANSHNINASLDMNKFYRYLGISKSSSRTSNTIQARKKDSEVALKNQKNTNIKKSNGLKNFGIGLLTMVKRIQFNYNTTSGTFLPGYLLSPGFIGTVKPTFGYTFGSQRDIRELAARKGWLTLYPEFNQQYTTTKTNQFDYSFNVEVFKDFKIDFIGNKISAENYTENYIIDQSNGDYEYQSLTPNTFGNFAISNILLKTAFSKSDENASKTFEKFRTNRLTIANRLAQQRGIDINNPANLDAEGYPLGYGKTNQAVLLPAFLAAYSGRNANKIKLNPFRDMPIPNWDIKYTGLMRLSWFKKRFKRLSLTHGYRSNYTINQYQTNLDYNFAAPDEVDQNDNFKNKTLYNNVNLTEQFSPLFRIDLETKNAIRILLEMRKDRALSLSFDNNLLTEIQGQEYTLGLGYRIKDLKIRSQLAGPKKVITSDLNLKADISLRDNKTIIRYLDVVNNQITAGQTFWNAKFTADYAFSKNLTGIFYFDYSFAEYAISTAFPQTNIRSGITLRYNFGN